MRATKERGWCALLSAALVVLGLISDPSAASIPKTLLPPSSDVVEWLRCAEDALSPECFGEHSDADQAFPPRLATSLDESAPESAQGISLELAESLMRSRYRLFVRAPLPLPWVRNLKPHGGAFDLSGSSQVSGNAGFSSKIAVGSLVNRWYDPSLGRFISQDPLGYVDGPSMYQFAGNSPFNYGDPLGLEAEKADEELTAILRRIQRAVDKSARLHGLNSIDEVRAGGAAGTEVHQTLQRLLARGGEFYDPRVLTEVEVDSSGTILAYGRRRRAAPGALVKDVIILRSGQSEVGLARGTKAQDVTQLVLDLKVGKKGARLRQTATMERFGVKNLVLSPHGNIEREYRHVLSDLRLVRKAGRLARYVPGAVALFAAILTADEVKAAAEEGNLARAISILSGTDMVEPLLQWVADGTETFVHEKLISGAIEAQEYNRRLIEQADQ